MYITFYTKNDNLSENKLSDNLKHAIYSTDLICDYRQIYSDNKNSPMWIRQVILKTHLNTKKKYNRNTPQYLMNVRHKIVSWDKAPVKPTKSIKPITLINLPIIPTKLASPVIPSKNKSSDKPTKLASPVKPSKPSKNKSLTQTISNCFNYYLDNFHENNFNDDDSYSDIILGEKYYFYDVNTIKKFNLPITSIYIYYVCMFGEVKVLEYLLKNNKFPSKDIYYTECVEIASKNGHINVLEWWKNSGLKFTCGRSVIIASDEGHIEILTWWKNSGLLIEYTNNRIEYTNDCITNASDKCNIDVLNWWKNSGLPLKYKQDSIDNASKFGNIKILKWWLNSGLELKYSAYAIDWASRNGHVGVLEWWKNSGLDLQYTNNALEWASENGHVNVLNWWKKSDLNMKYSDEFLNSFKKKKNQDRKYSNGIKSWWNKIKC
jgi:ankyrin repeat protein